HIPSGTEAKASPKVRMYGCNPNLVLGATEKIAWQTGASMYDSPAPSKQATVKSSLNFYIKVTTPSMKIHIIRMMSSLRA
ncbi:hypothetical protein ACUHMQ_18425, partial [Chitinimonas sp. PSY-7]|uniref:hypothetical protein n=1 Tax=Chitinimonas sp. PSY-7 TaxID=3459088 RepID=UPI0040402B56